MVLTTTMTISLGIVALFGVLIYLIERLAHMRAICAEPRYVGVILHPRKRPSRQKISCTIALMVLDGLLILGCVNYLLIINAS